MKDLSRRAVLTILAVLGAVPSLAAPSAAGDALPRPDKRVALSGHDPVSYFTVGRPEKGSAEFSANFDDAVYWFKNAEHRALFVGDPDRYAPQYNGFCAITVARGAMLEPDPEAWAIADGKLYVFGSKKGIAYFQQQTAGIVDKAAENWPGLHKRP